MSYLKSLMAHNEVVAFATRQHSIVLAGSFIVNLLIAAVIVLVAGLLAIPTAGLSWLIAILCAIPLARFIIRFIKWWNEQYVITNRRVIQTEGFITKHVIDSSLEKVNDVVLVQSMWGRLMDFGLVEIMTASEIGVNRLDRIKSPVKFKTAMLDQKEAMSSRDRSEDALAGPPAGAEDIPDIIAELDDLRKSGIISEGEFLEKKQDLLSKL